jgi:hypothetical protein
MIKQLDKVELGRIRLCGLETNFISITTFVKTICIDEFPYIASSKLGEVFALNHMSEMLMLSDIKEVSSKSMTASKFIKNSQRVVTVVTRIRLTDSAMIMMKLSA